jgi:HEAT repeat protein
VSSAVWQYDDGFRRSATLIESTMPINQGDSGGPVVDGRGQLVGVNAMFDPQSRQNSAHVDVSEVRDLLGKYFRSVGKTWSPAAEPTPAGSGERVHLLVQALGDGDAEVRRLAAVKLAAIGRDGREALPALLKVLRNPAEAEDVRKEVARALGELGPPAKEQLPLLGEALQDAKSTPARAYAADALGQLAADAKPAVPGLVKALRDPDVDVRRNAAAALGKVGVPARQEAYAELLALLQDKEEDVRRTALGALLKVDTPGAAELDALRKLLANQAGSREGRIYAAAALSELGPPAVPALVPTLATDPDPGVAMMACAALGQIGVKGQEMGQGAGKEGAEALRSALDHKERSVRVAAAAALGQLGLDGDSLPGILKALSRKDLECRRAVLSGLPPLGAFVKEPPRLTLPKEATEEIKPVLAADEFVARAVAAYLLGTMGADAGPAVPDMRKALAREKNDVAQRELLCAFAEIGPPAQAAFNELKDVVNDNAASKTAQTCAALALVRVEEKDDDRKMPAYRVLAKALEVKNARKNPDPIEEELSRRAQKALQKGKRWAALAIVQTAFTGDDADTVQASVTALQVLTKIGPAARGTAKASTDPVYAALVATRGNVGNDPDVLKAATEAYNAIYGTK